MESFKALGDENRIRILNLLIKEELCVCEIETILNITQSNASRHLNKLKSANIISSSKKAQWVHYQISEEFKSRHDLLLDYLKNELSKIQQCLEDIQRLERYKNSSYTCEHLRENKEVVVEYLE